MTPLPSIQRKKACTLCATLLLALLCGSCQQENRELPQPGSDAWVIRISPQSQASMEEEADRTFEDGDQVGVFIVKHTDGSMPTLLSWTNYLHNARFTYHSSWIPDQPIYWMDDSTHADIFLYYPYTSPMDTPRRWTVDLPADQSTRAAMRQADLLVGSAIDIPPTREDLRISTQHLMSRVIVRLKAGKGLTEEQLQKASLEVYLNKLITKATVDIATATVTTQGTATSDIRLCHTDSLTFMGIVTPQKVTEGEFITILFNGDRYTLSRSLTLQAGTSHTATVTLSKIDGNMGVTIKGWNTDPTDYGGTAE